MAGINGDEKRQIVSAFLAGMLLCSVIALLVITCLIQSGCASVGKYQHQSGLVAPGQVWWAFEGKWRRVTPGQHILEVDHVSVAVQFTRVGTGAGNWLAWRIGCTITPKGDKDKEQKLPPNYKPAKRSGLRYATRIDVCSD